MPNRGKRHTKGAKGKKNSKGNKKKPNKIKHSNNIRGDNNRQKNDGNAILNQGTSIWIDNYDAIYLGCVRIDDRKFDLTMQEIRLLIEPQIQDCKDFDSDYHFARCDPNTRKIIRMIMRDEEKTTLAKDCLPVVTVITQQDIEKERIKLFDEISNSSLPFIPKTLLKILVYDKKYNDGKHLSLAKQYFDDIKQMIDNGFNVNKN